MLFNNLKGIKMLTIGKYEIPSPKTAPYFSIDLPQDAKILTVQSQNNKPQIWALVDSENPKETRNFSVVATGGRINKEKEKLNYIGTFQMDEGNFVGHVFEEKD